MAGQIPIYNNPIDKLDIPDRGVTAYEQLARSDTRFGQEVGAAIFEKTSMQQSTAQMKRQLADISSHLLMTFEEITLLLEEVHRHIRVNHRVGPTDDGHVRFSMTNALASLVEGNQARRAGGVEGEARSSQVEEPGNAVGYEAE